MAIFCNSEADNNVQIFGFSKRTYFSFQIAKCMHTFEVLNDLQIFMHAVFLSINAIYL